MSKNSEIIEGARRVVAELIQAEINSRASALERLRRGSGRWYAIANLNLDLGLRVSKKDQRYILGVAAGPGDPTEVAEMRLRMLLNPASEGVEGSSLAPELRLRELSFVTRRADRLSFVGGPTVKLSQLKRKRWRHDELLSIFEHLNRWSEVEDKEVHTRALSEFDDEHYRLIDSIAAGMRALVAEFAGPTTALGAVASEEMPLAALLGTHYHLDHFEALVAMRLDAEGKPVAKASKLSQTLELRMALVHQPQRGEQLRVDVGFAGVVLGQHKQAVRRALADIQDSIADAVSEALRSVEVSGADLSRFLEQTDETGLFVGHYELGELEGGSPNLVVLLYGHRQGKPAYVLFDVVSGDGPDGEVFVREPRIIAVRWGKKSMNKVIGPLDKRDSALHRYLSVLMLSLASWV